MHAQAKRLQLSWAPDIALTIVIVAAILLFHARYVIAERYTLSLNDVFEYTLWGAFVVTMLGCARLVQRMADGARKRRKRYAQSLREDDTGSLSIEFLLTFPWMYIMFGMIIQWGLIGRAKIVVDYAAYRAARSAITQVESETWGPMYSLNPMSPESVPSVREARVREAAALILAQISPPHDSPGRGEWTDYGYGSGRTPAMAMAEAGIPRWPYAMRTDPYERRAHWALLQLEGAQQGGQGFDLEMRLSPLFTVDLSQFAAAAGNFADELENMLNEYAQILSVMDTSPDQTGFWGFKIPMPWPIPDIEVGVDLDDNSSTISDILGLPSPQDIADQIVDSILEPVREAILDPIQQMAEQIDDMVSDIDPGNPLTPREANITIRYPYQLRVPMVAQLVHPLWETRSGFRGRFIQIEAEIALQSTGGRAGNPLNLIAGSPLP